MSKLMIVFLCLSALILMLTPTKAVPIEKSLAPEAETEDLATADSIGVGYYAPSVGYYGASPYYGGGSYGGYGGYKYGGYSGYRYGGYGGYGRHYSRPIYPVWG